MGVLFCELAITENELWLQLESQQSNAASAAKDITKLLIGLKQKEREETEVEDRDSMQFEMEKVMVI